MNASLLAVVAIFIAFKAYERYFNPKEIIEEWMIAAAFLGAVMNWWQHEKLHDVGKEISRYWHVLQIGAFIFVMEITVGLLSWSLSLESDAWHVLVDNGAVIVSLVVAYILPERHDRNHITHGAMDAHIIGDFLQSLAVIGVGVWIYYTGDHSIDSILSGIIAFVLFVWAVKIAWDSWRGTFGLHHHNGHHHH